MSKQNENQKSSDISVINHMRQQYLFSNKEYRRAEENTIEDAKQELHHAIIDYYKVLRPHIINNQEQKPLKIYYNKILLYKTEENKIEGLKFLDNFLDNPLKPKKQTKKNYFGEHSSKIVYDKQLMNEEMMIRAGTILERIYNLLGFGAETEDTKQIVNAQKLKQTQTKSGAEPKTEG